MLSDALEEASSPKMRRRGVFYTFYRNDMIIMLSTKIAECTNSFETGEEHCVCVCVSKIKRMKDKAVVES